MYASKKSRLVFEQLLSLTLRSSSATFFSHPAERSSGR